MELAQRIALEMDRLASQWRSVPGIVAVSGGADSVGMLRLLAFDFPSGGRQPPEMFKLRGPTSSARSTRFIVAHVNHQLRGDESDADEAFVIKLATRLGLPIRTARIPVPPGNIENEARKSRYEFFRNVAAEMNAGWIATAHTLDDQAETVLHRLIRGTGIQGLRGIHPSPGVATPGLLIVRPLLAIRRSELREYLAVIQQPFREDSSNFDHRFTRNRIRHELLPLLESFNPQIAAVLNNLSQQASELHESAEGDTALLLKDVELERAGKMLIFDAEKLSSLTEPQRRAVLRMAWQREGWPEQGMTFSHWVRLANVAVDGRAVDFPGDMHARTYWNILQLWKKTDTIIGRTIPAIIGWAPPE